MSWTQVLWHLLTFEQKISGYYTPGTFQQYALAPANYVTPIPDGLDSAAAAPMLCAGVTVYSALRKANAEAGYVIPPKNLPTFPSALEPREGHKIAY